MLHSRLDEIINKRSASILTRVATRVRRQEFIQAMKQLKHKQGDENVERTQDAERIQASVEEEVSQV